MPTLNGAVDTAGFVILSFPGMWQMFTDRIKRHDSKSIQKRWSSKVRLDRFKLADIAVPIKDHPTSFLILTNINTQIFCPRVSFVDSFKPALQRNIPSYITKLLFSPEKGKWEMYFAIQQRHWKKWCPFEHFQWLHWQFISIGSKKRLFGMVKMSNSRPHFNIFQHKTPLWMVENEL